MGFTFWLLNAVNGLAYASILFILAVGLSLTFGVMRVLNLAHASFYLLGAYIALSTLNATGSFVAAIAAGAAALAVLGGLLYRGLLKRTREGSIEQVLITMGLVLIIANFCLWVWGGVPQMASAPNVLDGAVHFGPLFLPKYRVFLIVAGLGLMILLWLGLERTKIGAMVRAAVDDPAIANAHGIPVEWLKVGVFTFGALLAAVAGALALPMLGVHPGADTEMLPLAFGVIIVGGIGSVLGTMLGALVLGEISTFSNALAPEVAYVTMFIPVLLVLAFRPTGLIGRR